MAKPKRAALYVRVSTDHQSVENQVRELKDVAERRGWTVVEIYRDAAMASLVDATAHHENPGDPRRLVGDRDRRLLVRHAAGEVRIMASKSRLLQTLMANG